MGKEDIKRIEGAKMKLKDQVISLKLAKKLKKLGVKQESLFYWVNGSLAVNSSREIPEVLIYSNKGDLWENPDRLLGEFNRDRIFSAFTVAELGEMLPDNLVSSGMDEGKWSCVYGLKEDGDDMPDCIWEDESKYEFGYMTITDDTEVNARAKMLIYLIENK